MDRLNLLKLALFNLGLKKESYDVKEIKKESTIKGIQILGLPVDVAFIINSKVGDKWDFVVAKWMLELEGIKTKEEYESFIQSSFGTIRLPGVAKALLYCKKLYLKPIEERNKEEQNTYFKCFDACLYSKREYFDNYKDEVIEDSTIEYWEAMLKEVCEKEVNLFLHSSFVQEVINEKWKPLKFAKNTSFYDAKKDWMETRSYDTFLEINKDWRWVNVGGGHSDWIAEKLKNCGSSNWGNLRASGDSGKHAIMLILIGPGEKPHAIVTYNPKYEVSTIAKDRSGNYKQIIKKKKYLGHIEGVGSSPLSPEYGPYFMKLYEYINPDLVYISNKATYGAPNEEGKFEYRSNEYLKEQIEKDKLMI